MNIKIYSNSLRVSKNSIWSPTKTYNCRTFLLETYFYGNKLKEEVNDMLKLVKSNCN